MSKLVRGDRLPSNLRREVLARYIYRWTSGNPERERAWRGLIEGTPKTPLVSDEQWLRDNAFYVTDRGTLDKRRMNAEPAFMVETEAGQSGHATKKSPAQLQRDIDEALTGKRLSQHATKKPAKDTEAAILAAQLYFGSDNYSSIRDQQKLYQAMRKRIAAIANRRGMDEHDAHEQITNEAKRRGPIRPIPGKHV